MPKRRDQILLHLLGYEQNDQKCANVTRKRLCGTAFRQECAKVRENRLQTVRTTRTEGSQTAKTCNEEKSEEKLENHPEIWILTDTGDQDPEIISR